jgi:hypothetical protein
MKNFQMLPLDTSITNTENPLAFQHYQTLDLEQTKRLMSRIQLANYFKQQAFESIGVNAQRLGGAIAQETATGVTQALNQSYAQTEIYFNQHSDYLMPRVHQMRTDLAQFYQSSNPSIRLSYITSEAEKVNFSINGTTLLLRDFNVFATTKTNHRSVLDQLKQLAIQNNTAGASIYDLGNIIKSESIAEITTALKTSEAKQNELRNKELENQRQMQEQQLQARAMENQEKINFEASENEKNRQKDIIVAEIRSAAFGSGQDVNQNMVSDYKDAMGEIRKTTEYQEQMNFKREENATKTGIEREKLNVEKERLTTQRDVAQTQLEIARENKNKYDSKPNKK